MQRDAVAQRLQTSLTQVLNSTKIHKALMLLKHENPAVVLSSRFEAYLKTLTQHPPPPTDKNKNNGLFIALHGVLAATNLVSFWLHATKPKDVPAMDLDGLIDEAVAQARDKDRREERERVQEYMRLTDQFQSHEADLQKEIKRLKQDTLLQTERVLQKRGELELRIQELEREKSLLPTNRLQTTLQNEIARLQAENDNCRKQMTNTLLYYENYYKTYYQTQVEQQRLATEKPLREMQQELGSLQHELVQAHATLDEMHAQNMELKAQLHALYQQKGSDPSKGLEALAQQHQVQIADLRHELESRAQAHEDELHNLRLESSHQLLQANEKNSVLQKQVDASRDECLTYVNQLNELTTELTQTIHTNQTLQKQLSDNQAAATKELAQSRTDIADLEKQLIEKHQQDLHQLNEEHQQALAQCQARASAQTRQATAQLRRENASLNAKLQAVQAANNMLSDDYTKMGQRLREFEPQDED